MSSLTVKGTQTFMGKEIPVVLGGFGDDKKCISDKTIAEIHSMETRHVRELITRNLSRFQEDIDIIDAKIVAVQNDNNLDAMYNILREINYTNMEIGRANHIYILSERGYAKLIKIMDTDLAWQIHDKLVDEYFTLREQVRQPIDMSALSPELQMFKQLWDGVARTELEQKRQAQQLEIVNKRVDDIRNVVATTPTNNTWRDQCRALIVKMAQAEGGGDAYKAINHKIFTLVDKRAGVSLNVRLTNHRNRMAEQGVCKSTRDKVNKLDIIAEDKKLIEIYTAIVKELAVKCGVA